MQEWATLGTGSLSFRSLARNYEFEYKKQGSLTLSRCRDLHMLQANPPTSSKLLLSTPTIIDI
jgi:hypothetical protein